MSTILRVLALLAFLLAVLSGAAVISPTSDWLDWPTLIAAGLAFWVGSTLA